LALNDNMYLVQFGKTLKVSLRHSFVIFLGKNKEPSFQAILL